MPSEKEVKAKVERFGWTCTLPRTLPRSTEPGPAFDAPRESSALLRYLVDTTAASLGNVPYLHNYISFFPSYPVSYQKKELLTVFAEHHESNRFQRAEILIFSADTVHLAFSVLRYATI